MDDSSADTTLALLIAEREMLNSRLAEACNALAQAVKSAVASHDPRGGPKRAAVRGCAERLRELQKEADELDARIGQCLGVSMDEVDALLASRLPHLEDRYDRRDVVSVPPDYDFEDALASSLERLLTHVDPGWLRTEAEKGYRLDSSYLVSPLALVGSHRILQKRQRPQRLALSLLLCEDHLEKRDDLDFWSLPMLAAEVAALGTVLDFLPELGAVAQEKYRALQQMDDDLEASTVYELLVGLACARKGLRVEMLTENAASKTPEYRVHSFPVPMVIECKRRRVSEYLLAEGEHALSLLSAVHTDLTSLDAHVSIDAEFTADIRDVSGTEFREAVLAVLPGTAENARRAFGWGTIALRSLPREVEFSRTRLYAPSFLSQVYGVPEDSGEWDGLVCSVDPPRRVVVDSAASPCCLRWRCSNPETARKRDRGVSSLFEDALKQVPDGEMGIIYLAYEETAREEVANARTRRIIGEMQAWGHRWGIVVPLIIVNRLYPRPLGVGQPDIIDSALPFAPKDVGNSFLGDFPARVFVPELP